VDEVLRNALTSPLVPIEWEADQEPVSIAKTEAAVEGEVGVVTH
jgi:hypothetical protein